MEHAGVMMGAGSCRYQVGRREPVRYMGDRTLVLRRNQDLVGLNTES